MATSPPRGPITAVVVTYESEASIGPCLEALRRAAPRRGIDLKVVDNASGDAGAARAADVIGPDNVIRLSENRGFAAGVNAVLDGFQGDWLAVINPDVLVPEGALDRLADAMEGRPRLGLAGPRVRDPRGGWEASAGFFPTLERVRAHALFMDRWLGREGRMRRVSESTAVDWVSGCAWLLRGEAIRNVGVLDPDYFMYCEDIDYCRRLWDSGWEVMTIADVEVQHDQGQGSARSAELPADGATAVLRYFRKFDPGVDEREVEGALRRGWRLRLAWHGLRSALGDRRSHRIARRYRLALDAPPSRIR